jgi:hypothetical protein
MEQLVSSFITTLVLKNNCVTAQKVGQGLSGGFDKWDVEQKLHRSEGRVQSLEETLTTNAKSWAREKAALELQLSELKAQLASTRYSSHALTHSMPSVPHPTGVMVKKVQ